MDFPPGLRVESTQQAHQIQRPRESEVNRMRAPPVGGQAEYIRSVRLGKRQPLSFGADRVCLGRLRVGDYVGGRRGPAGLKHLAPLHVDDVLNKLAVLRQG